MDYVYAQPEPEPDDSVVNLAPPEMPEFASKIKSKTLLGSQQVEASVQSGKVLTENVDLKRDLGDQLQSLQSQPTDVDSFSQPNYILDVDVTYTNQPEGTYDVYLNLPHDEKTMKAAMADIDTYFIGGILFFGSHSDRPESKTFEFDITDELLQQIQKCDSFSAK